MFLGECNYGGKISDIWDRRCLLTILEDFICSHVVFDPSYLLSNVSKQYGLPYRCEHHDYIQHIENMSTSTVPEVLGLHWNVGYTFNCKVILFFYLQFSHIIVYKFI